MRSFISILTLTIIAATALAQVVPSWWHTRNVFEPNSTPDDYVAINQGQLKNFAREAYDEFVYRLPSDWSQSTLTTLIESWETPSELADDYQVVTVTQLKQLLALFYTALEGYRMTHAPGWQPVANPWGEVAVVEALESEPIVNIGQVKQAFLGLQGNRRAFGSGDLSALGETERQSGTSLTGERFGFGLDWMDDTDGDGASDLLEVLAGADANHGLTESALSDLPEEDISRFNLAGRSPANTETWQRTEYDGAGRLRRITKTAPSDQEQTLGIDEENNITFVN
jgi:hypothetical protein